MGLTSYVRSVLNSAVSPYGYELIQSSKLHDLKERFGTLPRYTSSPLPEGASSYLCHRNPQLEALRDRYSAFDKSVTHPLVWKDTHVQPDDILYFRGDNAYVWQLKGQNMTDTAYGLTAYYVKSIDTLGLLSQLREDSFFGNFTFDIDSKLISRDLLDSIVEIYFLEKHLNISCTKNLTILDIGAGYGRLAHRMIRAFPNIQNYLCTDGVAVSSFIAEYYLQFRSLDSKAKSVPLDEIDSVLNDLNIRLVG
ncbi:MAG: hypothetical protein DCF15_15765 [Phormidesmis priestleyi]|uniref:Sugar O-methyltransferase n=1 Tax=Phormidesmis priestleyi TaxID=268141 RepID=A0A2W4YU52_9CYAN|nr:MAG: hypothetical protein DCF15_15765 [Phormidesmis priestleyi]